MYTLAKGLGCRSTRRFATSDRHGPRCGRSQVVCRIGDVLSVRATGRGGGWVFRKFWVSDAPPLGVVCGPGQSQSTHIRRTVLRQNEEVIEGA